MKNRINLFSKKKQQQPIPSLAIKMRSIMLLLCLLSVLICLISGFLYYQAQNKYLQIQARLNTLRNQKGSQKQIEGGLLYFVSKKEQLKNVLKDDVEFEKYYAVVNEAISYATGNAYLDNIRLNSNRGTQFTIKFDSYEAAQPLLNFIESEQFLKSFTNLELASFAINGASEQKKDFSLVLRGDFKDLSSSKKDVKTGGTR